MVNSDPLIPFFGSKSSETDSNRVKIGDDDGHSNSRVYSSGGFEFELYPLMRDENRFTKCFVSSVSTV